MMLANFFFRPYLEPGEKILHVFHRHAFVMIPAMLRIGFMGLAVPLFLMYLFPEFILLFAIWVTVTLVRMMYVLFNWYHDAVLATDMSLIAVKWNGFFDRSSSRMEYQMIDGTATEIRGLRRTIFNYGHVTISGSATPMHLKDAYSPKRMEKKIMAQQEKYVHHQSMQDSDSLKTLLTTVIRNHNTGTGASASGKD